MDEEEIFFDFFRLKLIKKNHLFIFIPIFLLIYFSSKKVLFKTKNIVEPIIDQAWVSALITLIFSQMVDVQYFDGRISIILWLLLVGAKSIIIEAKNL